MTDLHQYWEVRGQQVSLQPPADWKCGAEHQVEGPERAAGWIQRLQEHRHLETGEKNWCERLTKFDLFIEPYKRLLYAFKFFIIVIKLYCILLALYVMHRYKVAKRCKVERKSQF